MENPQGKDGTLLVWDAEGAPPAGNHTKVLWNSFGNKDSSGSISIPGIIEENAEAYRARYLAWIYETGETRIGGKRIVDHLELRPGFSFWWMTSLAQKFNISGTSPINNAIKAFALEDLISKYKTKSIRFVSGNEKLAAVLRNLCQNLKLDFKWDSSRSDKSPEPFAKRIYSFLPYRLQAFIYFIWYLSGRLLINDKKSQTRNVNGEICFIDVLVHLDRKAYTDGKFISNYWTTLVDKLALSGIRTNWLHNYFRHDPLPSPFNAQKLLDSFNKNSDNLQLHALVESNLTLSVCLNALKDYFRLNIFSLNLSPAKKHFMPSGSSLDLWPLFREEWLDSLTGQGAMLSCLRISLYEKIFSEISHQKIGVYIQENQPWETALIYAWKAAGHGKLIGTPHTNVRFWDLRYFYDNRTYKDTGKNVLPIPDIVAVNGPIAKKAYLEGGYPEVQVAEVEALRFLHLLNRTTINAYAYIQSTSIPLNVLICGDFLSATNSKILSWLSIAARSLPPETSYVFKPHPAYPIKLSNYNSLSLESTNAPLAKLFEDCDVVFTSNITSAAVDAYCAGFPVVQMLDGNDFNMSPLRGLKGVVYVTTPEYLADALLKARQREGFKFEQYFYLDADLPHWLRLLGIPVECSV
jgi:surface carbohydrate biosynthesis protein (TIGR04326 family)